MFKTILGQLFVAYREPGEMTWASWWMHKHGRLFIGDPAPHFKARNIHPELIKSYYFTKDDRQIGSVKDLTKWRFDSIYVNAYRRYEERHVAWAASLAAMALCAVILAAGGALHMANKGRAALGTIGCAGYIQDVEKGAIKAEDVDRERLSACRMHVRSTGGKS